jgi:hypothetical protein
MHAASASVMRIMATAIIMSLEQQEMHMATAIIMSLEQQEMRTSTNCLLPSSTKSFAFSTEGSSHARCTTADACSEVSQIRVHKFLNLTIILDGVDELALTCHQNGHVLKKLS